MALAQLYTQAKQTHLFNFIKTWLLKNTDHTKQNSNYLETRRYESISVQFSTLCKTVKDNCIPVGKNCIPKTFLLLNALWAQAFFIFSLSQWDPFGSGQNRQTLGSCNFVEPNQSRLSRIQFDYNSWSDMSSWESQSHNILKLKSPDQQKLL